MAFIATRKQSDGDYVGKLETYAIDAAHARIVAQGDSVIITGTADAEGRAEVDNFADGEIATRITGVVASIDPQFVGENLSTTALPASTAGTVKVHIDPKMDFLADSDGTLVADNVGLNVGFNALESSNSLGSSNYTLDSSSVAVTNTLPFRIIALAEDNAGVLGNRAYVRINDGTLDVGTTGV